MLAQKHLALANNDNIYGFYQNLKKLDKELHQKMPKDSFAAFFPSGVPSVQYVQYIDYEMQNGLREGKL